MASDLAEWSQPVPEWLSLQQSAQLLGVSVDTIRRRIAAGVLPVNGQWDFPVRGHVMSSSAVT